jgi:hypothetical protein
MLRRRGRHQLDPLVLHQRGIVWCRILLPKLLRRPLNKMLHQISSTESSLRCLAVSALLSSNISSRGNFHITSGGNIASDPYTRKKGDCLVALLGCVRSPQTTDEISSIHLPPFCNSRHRVFTSIHQESSCWRAQPGHWPAGEPLEHI